MSEPENSQTQISLPPKESNATPETATSETITNVDSTKDSNQIQSSEKANHDSVLKESEKAKDESSTSLSETTEQKCLLNEDVDPPITLTPMTADLENTNDTATSKLIFFFQLI